MATWERDFFIVASSVWNSLLVEIRLVSSGGILEAAENLFNLALEHPFVLLHWFMFYFMLAESPVFGGVVVIVLHRVDFVDISLLYWFCVGS